MSRPLILVAFLALLATDAVVKVEAVFVASAVVTAAGMVYGTLSGGVCGGLLGGATKCQCRDIYLVLQSGSPDQVYPGPRLHYQASKTDITHGQLCALGTGVISNGTSGGIRIGNTGRTYMTGAEGWMRYQLFSSDGRTGYDCYVKVWLDNPYWGANQYSATTEGNACPGNLKIELGQYVKGEVGAVVQYFVYLETASVGPTPVPNVMKLLEENKDKGFGILLSVLKAAGPKLQKALLDPKAKMTVFAPVDSAFTSLMERTNTTLKELLSDPDLNAVLRYHVIGGNAYSSASLAGRKIVKVQTTLPGPNGILTFQRYNNVHGPSVSISTTSNPPVVAKVVTRDIPVGSAIVHVVTKVLLPGW